MVLVQSWGDEHGRAQRSDYSMLRFSNPSLLFDDVIFAC